jgi:hypothetical protein
MARLKKDPAWIVFPPAGVPELSRDPRAPDVCLPDDVLSSYQLCGGMKTKIRTDDDLYTQIVPAAGFNWAIKEIIGSLYDKDVGLYGDNILWSCYVVASVGTDSYLLVDLAPERYERCYYTYLYFFSHRG